MDHNDDVISMNSSYELDLYVTATRVSYVLRVASTNEHFLTVHPNLSSNVKYSIFRVMLSARGYVVIQARSQFKAYGKDMLLTYTINGEEVCRVELEEVINDLLFDIHEYFIVSKKSKF